MDRKGFGAILDETVSKMEHDVRVLKTQSVTLAENIKLQESARNKISEEIAKGEQKLARIKEEYKNKVDGMLKSAQDKLDSATEKESQAVGKIAELNEKIKAAEGIVKSNQGLQKNLNNQETELKSKTEKLETLVKQIKITIETL